jgi:hypothetical protein
VLHLLQTYPIATTDTSAMHIFDHYNNLPRLLQSKVPVTLSIEVEHPVLDLRLVKLDWQDTKKRRPLIGQKCIDVSREFVILSRKLKIC